MNADELKEFLQSAISKAQEQTELRLERKLMEAIQRKEESQPEKNRNKPQRSAEDLNGGVECDEANEVDFMPVGARVGSKITAMDKSKCS